MVGEALDVADRRQAVRVVVAVAAHNARAGGERGRRHPVRIIIAVARRVLITNGFAPTRRQVRMKPERTPPRSKE